MTRAALTALTLLAFVLGVLRFEGPTEGYWDTYIAAPAMFLTGTPVDFVLKDGRTAWQVQLGAGVPADLIDHDSFGIITKDQRIGSPVLAAPFFLFFGLAGFHLLYALANALIVPTTWLALRGVVHDRRAALLATGWMAFNPYVLSVDRLNANLLVLPLELLLITLLLRPKLQPVVVGLLLGVLAGVRNEAICFVPAICAWVLSGPSPLRRRLGQLVVVGAACVVAMLPVFAWKWHAFGHPLMHPSQYAHFQGFRPEFPHRFGPWEFSFNGLFNWPFHDRLVRTPHFGYPTWLSLPLVVVSSLGTVGTAVLLWGAAVTPRRLLAFCLLWMGGVYALFGPQENWEEVKMTFGLLAWAPLPLLLGLGLQRVASHRGRWPRLLAAAAAVTGMVRVVAAVDAPADERWYVRFPNAALATNPGAQAGLDPHERNDWIYFQSYETPDEIAREKARLTSALPWPTPYLPVDLRPGKAWTKLRRGWGQHELTVLEIWGYIYGSRR